jgi:hypothetical protein
LQEGSPETIIHRPVGQEWAHTDPPPGATLPGDTGCPTNPTRRTRDGAQHLTHEQVPDEDATVRAEPGRAHDCLEGVAAFAAKRAPVFTDR